MIWAAVALFGIPALVAVVVIGAILRKQAARTRFMADLQARLGAPGRVHGDTLRFEILGRAYLLTVHLNPLFSKFFDLRLSTFCDSVLDFEVREAKHFPRVPPEALRKDPLFRRCGIEAPSLDEPLVYLAQVRETLVPVFPKRWTSFSKMHLELVLSGNRFTSWDDDALRTDLAALDALAKVPAWRKPHGGTWTYREGWEPRVPAWHWKPDQRARLPEGTRRWLISCWYDNAYLNRPLLDVLQLLAGGRETAWITSEKSLSFLEAGFQRPARINDNLVSVDAEMALAADQYLDGEFMSGFVAFTSKEVRTAFAGAIRFNFHEHATRAMPQLHLYARRLYDDEFSWFSGEYEIVSATLNDDDVRRAMEEVAKAYGATVKEIGRPFSFKLLRDDRLDLSF